jgi:hypothetical protein
MKNNISYKILSGIIGMIIFSAVIGIACLIVCFITLDFSIFSLSFILNPISIRVTIVLETIGFLWGLTL